MTHRDPNRAGHTPRTRTRTNPARKGSRTHTAGGGVTRPLRERAARDPQRDLADLTHQTLVLANELRLADLVGRERDHALLAAAALDDLRHLLLGHEDHELGDQLEITDAIRELGATAHRPARSADLADEETA